MERLRDPYPPTLPPGQDELPCSDGDVMDTNRHRQQMNLLIGSLREAWRDRDDVFVSGNMYVYYSELQTKTNDFRGPDVFVVLDAIKGRVRKSWVVWEENLRLPNVVIELVSPSTEHVDRGEKKRIYERVWRLPEYFLYDPYDPELEGFRLVNGRFVPIEPNADGSLDCRELGLRLVVREGVYEEERCLWLRWLDPQTGLLLPTGTERGDEAERHAREAERHAREAERHAREAERHARDTERELRDAEARAQEIEQRARESERRAQDAERRAEALAARLAELEGSNGLARPSRD